MKTEYIDAAIEKGVFTKEAIGVIKVRYCLKLSKLNKGATALKKYEGTPEYEVNRIIWEAECLAPYEAYSTLLYRLKEKGVIEFSDEEMATGFGVVDCHTQEKAKV